MTFEEYRKQTTRTMAPLAELYGINIINQSFEDIGFNFDDETSKNWNDLPHQLDQSHMIEGMFSELEELIDAVNRRDSINIMEELGDICWYVSNFININYEEFDHEIKEFLPLNTSMEVGEMILKLTYYISKLSNFTKRELAYRQFKVSNRVKCVVYIIDVMRWIYYIADRFNIDVDKMLDRNIAKLYIRYPKSFNEEDACIRNLEAELKELEK